MAVTLSLEGSEPQRRATVAFRLVLAIPHLILVSLLSLVAVVVIFFAWFAVLFTARMPRGMGDLLGRILQYQARAEAYSYFLLTDVYPPFDVGPREYPVMLELDEPGRFNRMAVLFRAFLQLPALIISQAATTGSLVIMFVVWLVTLISGRMPPTAYVAMACILRYQLHTYAYIGMLTTEYPRGLFGDRDEDRGMAPPVELDELPRSPRATRLVLSGGAKALVAIALLLGTGAQALNLATTDWGAIDRTAKLAALDRDFDRAFDEWSEQSRDCTRAELPADCHAAANGELRSAITSLRGDLFVFEVPEAAIDEGLAVIGALDEMQSLLLEMDTLGPDDQLRVYFLLQDGKDDYDERFHELLDAVRFR